MCSTKESHDSDADLDVDGDDTLEYGKAQYPWLVVMRRLALQWRCSRHRNSNWNYLHLFLNSRFQVHWSRHHSLFWRGPGRGQRTWGTAWGCFEVSWNDFKMTNNKSVDLALMLNFCFFFLYSGGLPSNRITPEFSKWVSDGELAFK